MDYKTFEKYGTIERKDGFCVFTENVESHDQAQSIDGKFYDILYDIDTDKYYWDYIQWF